MWWTVKYQYLYLRAFEGGADLRSGLKSWFEFYNSEWPHQAHGGRTPDQVLRGTSQGCRSCLRLRQIKPDQSLFPVSNCPIIPGHLSKLGSISIQPMAAHRCRWLLYGV